MSKSVDAELNSLLNNYLRNWGPVKWRNQLATSKPPENPVLGNILLSVSAVEADSRIAFRKLQAAGLDKRPSIRDFGIAWVAEEAEHSRAILELARLLGSTTDAPKVRQSYSIADWPVVVLSRSFRTLIEPIYLIVGAAAEYLAIVTYREVAKYIGDPDAAHVLHVIAAQEARHLRFYRCAANAILEREPHPLLIPMILKHYWRPVGTDVLGEEAWFSAFSHLLAKDSYRARIVRLDEMIQSLPGLDGLSLMRPILSKRGYITPTVRETRIAQNSLSDLSRLGA